ncbi:MAG: sodium-translocating pyrophosphatase [Chloroflexota bacterium]|nr:MAG: sodium-translocating pyrophosphatase [Chloroflexota bacterium]
MDTDLLAHVFVIVSGVLGLAVLAGLYSWLKKQDPGTERMQEIAGFIQEGANAFLRREFLTITPFIIGLAILLYFAMPEAKWQIAVGFVMGAVFSLLSVYIGMNAATRANVRTTQAARTSIGKALTVAFRGGSIMGLSIVTFNMLGIVLMMYLFGIGKENPHDVSMLVGFGFGASLSALFAQLGGGIYTKAADIGADLVGKVEAGMPEDDPRNPAAIADQVGDNVGDCAGRGADLFESGSDNVITTMMVASSPIFIAEYGWAGVLFPLFARGIGVIATIIGVFLAQGKDDQNPIKAVNISFLTTALVNLAGFYALSHWIMKDIGLFWAQVLGMVGVLGIVVIVQYYTGAHSKPVRSIARNALGGPALTILEGFAYGMESTVWGIFLVASIILGAFLMGIGKGSGEIIAVFYIAAATMGIKEMKGIIMAGDTFGPIVDNAAGISEMSGLGEETRKVGDSLDAVGNVTKALAKGYAMAAATMGSMVILLAYLFEIARLDGTIHLTADLTKLSDFVVINIVNPANIAAVFVGIAMPYLFSGLTIRAVNKGAYQVMEEVRRQWREIPGLLEGKAKADYAKAVDLTTVNALREMVAPTLISLVIPVVIGFILGPWSLAVFLISVTGSSAALASAQFNAGGALDNAKKLIEEGEYGGKGSDAHAAAVSGDTFGDPLKDTAGPALHILIKLQSIMSITLLPIYMKYGLNLFH